jgi:hypothetical protein
LLSAILAAAAASAIAVAISASTISFHIVPLYRNNLLPLSVSIHKSPIPILPADKSELEGVLG